MLLKQEIEYFSLLNRNKTVIYHVVRMYAHGDKFYTSELQQEIAYALWCEFSKYGKLRYDSAKTERIYVVRTAVNTIISYYRQFQSKLPTIPINDDILNIEFTDDDQCLQEDVHELILTLSAQDQRLVFYYLEQYPYARIAEFEDMTESAVGTRMSRIFKKLRKKYKK